MLRHDPTFEGLLSAIAICLRDGIRPEALVPDLDQLTLLPCTDTPLVPGIRGIFRSQLGKRMGAATAEEVLKTAWQAYLSEDEGIGLAIFSFISAALKRRGDPSGDLLDRDISRVVRMSQKTARLAHAFLGLVRFRTVGPSLYLADFSPEHHVLPLILPHFCERLPDQCFVIRDQRRGLAALHVPLRPPQIFVLAPPGEDGPMAGAASAPAQLSGASLWPDQTPGLPFELPLGLPAGPVAVFADGTPASTHPTTGAAAPSADIAAPSTGAAAPSADAAAPSTDAAAPSADIAAPSVIASADTADEAPAAMAVASADAARQQDFDEMWRRYLAALSIPERRNLKLQRAHMPKKYWKYLTEQPGGAWAPGARASGTWASGN